MNIFVVDPNPRKSARSLPDKHIVKMPLESCQMLSIIYSKWYYNWGDIHKIDGNPYNTKKGAFKNHPCTIWASKNYYNLAWLISHGCALTMEYYFRYGKVHSCAKTLMEAKRIFHKKSGILITAHSLADNFARAMPDDLKYNSSISTFEAYKLYINTKPWVKDNYVKIPSRKPDWISNT